MCFVDGSTAKKTFTVGAARAYKSCQGAFTINLGKAQS
jgi:hypothetical protein